MPSNHFPNFVANGESLEDDVINPSEEKNDADSATRRAARNFLRHLTRGTRVDSGKQGKRYHAGLALAEKSLNEKSNPALLSALRIELTALIANATQWITTHAEMDVELELQFELFIEGLLAVYPFIEPNASETVVLPQKINLLWQPVECRFERIDISPQTGLLARLIEDEDRIYAYGLVPTQSQQPEAKPHLLLMGTPQPTGQGEALADLYNFYPKHSVGEAHHMTQVDAWIASQKNQIIAVGQSKGAVMAMILAARFPLKISHAYALCPTALTQATLNRLRSQWNACPQEERAQIVGIVQKGDPVFYLENGFLPGTVLYHVEPTVPVVSNYKRFLPTFLQKAFESHLHNFSGRDNVIINKKDIYEINRSRWREFGSDFKGFLNHFLFPIKYFNFCALLCARKLERYSGLFKVITYPLSFVGKIINPMLKLTSMVSAIVLTTVFSGTKIAIRSLFGIRSDYQKLGLKVTSENSLSTTATLSKEGYANLQAPLLSKQLLEEKQSGNESIAGVQNQNLPFSSEPKRLCSL